jgi:hypothetical protein
MGAPGSRAVALGAAAVLLLLVALPSAFVYLTTSAASRSALPNLRPFSARCPPAAPRLHVRPARALPRRHDGARRRQRDAVGAPRVAAVVGRGQAAAQRGVLDDGVAAGRVGARGRGRPGAGPGRRGRVLLLAQLQRARPQHD